MLENKFNKIIPIKDLEPFVQSKKTLYLSPNLKLRRMKVKKQGNTTIVKDTQGDVKTLVLKIEEQYGSFSDTNLVIDVSSSKNLGSSEVAVFSKLASKHHKNKKSFVLVVAPDFDFNEVTDKVMVVPTLQEAHDIIEMEEIERDLGFEI